jgi:cytochrome c553
MPFPNARFRVLSIAAFAGATGLAAFSTYAQTPPARLGLCASCHGEHGVANMPTVPNLAAQNLVYLRNALQQYKSGARDVPAMRAAASMLSEAEADQVLQWYAAQPPTSPAP